MYTPITNNSDSVLFIENSLYLEICHKQLHLLVMFNSLRSSDAIYHR